MEKEIHKIFSDARSLSLTSAEKAAGREMLRQYMAMRPVRVAPASSSVLGSMAKKLWCVPSLASFAKPLGVFTLVLGLMLSAAGVSYAAEGALPGDALYPVKVSINEEIRAAAAISVIDRTRWENERASRRLSEAEALARKGQFQKEVAAELLTRLETHLGLAQSLEADFEAQQQERQQRRQIEIMSEINASFEGKLRAHKKLLGLLTSVSEQDEPSAKLAAVVDLQAEMAGKRRLQAEERLWMIAAGTFSSADMEVRTKNAHRAIAGTKSLLGKTRARMDEETVIAVEAKLAAAEKAMAERDEKIAAGDQRAAVGLYFDALRDADEGKSLIKSGALIAKGGRWAKDDGEKKQVENKDKQEGNTGSGSGVRFDAGAEVKGEAGGGDGDDETDDADDRRRNEERGDALLRTEGRLKVQF